MFFTPSQICVLVLIIIAAVVSVFQIKKMPKHAWPWIIGYWVVLTIKNIFDLVAML